jgi:hypothetical protein
VCGLLRAVRIRDPPEGKAGQGELEDVWESKSKINQTDIKPTNKHNTNTNPGTSFSLVGATSPKADVRIAASSPWAVPPDCRVSETWFAESKRDERCTVHPY